MAIAHSADLYVVDDGCGHGVIVTDQLVHRVLPEGEGYEGALLQC